MNFNAKYIFLSAACALLLCCSAPEEWQYDVITDSRDGKTYKIIDIGKQTWMAENLNYDVPESLCYNNEPANCDIYGRLYNWETALSICPEGWRLPSDADWEKLIGYVEGEDVDNYGFSVLLSGYYSPDNNTFSYIDTSTVWWSSLEILYSWDGEHFPTARTRTKRLGSGIGSSFYKKQTGVSVRCIKGNRHLAGNNNSNSLDIIYGEDLVDNREKLNPQTYKTVIIGKQTWTAENLNYYIEGSVCYNLYKENCEKYGRLYKLEMAMEACPAGWHLPSDEEWTELENFAGDSSAIKLKAASGWSFNDFDNVQGNGTDNYGFSALPAGPGGPNGDFSYGGNRTFWWSSTRYLDMERDFYYRAITYNDTNIRRGMTWGAAHMSVRCIKDSE